MTRASGWECGVMSVAWAARAPALARLAESQRNQHGEECQRATGCAHGVARERVSRACRWHGEQLWVSESGTGAAALQTRLQKDPMVDRLVADAVRTATKQAKERALKEEHLRRHNIRMLAGK